MKNTILSICCLLTACAAWAQSLSRVDSMAVRLADEGFANVRAVETADYTVFTIENDRYKIPAEGFAYAARLIESSGLGASKPVKIIGTSYKIPEVTLTYQGGDWTTTKRLDASWDAVRKQPKRNNSFGKIDLVVYPQVSLMNLIINQVYQSLFTINPSVEVSLWPGSKLTYQLVIPIFTDFFEDRYYKVHPGFITFSQRFRDPWHLNIQGKFTIGTFSANRYGAALEAWYYFPNERFSVDAQFGLLALSYFEGFIWKHAVNLDDWKFLFSVGANYYNAALKTQFSLHASRFIQGDYGLKFEMIRHFRHCSIGFYLEKGGEMYANRFGFENIAKTNGGFRFQIALPPYRMKRHGYIPRVTTSGQMGLGYNANNEQYFYKEYKTEASDNIMSANYYNPYYINSRLRESE